MTLSDLADKVERLTGPCRETDALIDATLRIGKPSHPGWIRKNFSVWRGLPDGRVEVVHTDDKGGANWESVRFTASLDAAMTLVPEGFVWTVAKYSSGRFWASVAHPDDEDDGHPTIDPTVTAAGALTSASLRARASSMEAHRG